MFARALVGPQKSWHPRCSQLKAIDAEEAGTVIEFNKLVETSFPPITVLLAGVLWARLAVLCPLPSSSSPQGRARSPRSLERGSFGISAGHGGSRPDL